MSNPNFLNALADGSIALPSGPWVAEKLDYLSRYIDIFETSMKAKWPRRNYIDLFAGPGKNRIRNTGEYLLGSPLLALTTHFPFTGYYFVENDHKNSEALRVRCSASPYRNLTYIYTGDANRITPSIVSTIQHISPRSLNLAFLDPYGLELEWSSVSNLGSLRCDLIIHYSQQGISRFIGKAFVATSETVIDRFFGTIEWRKVYAPWHKKSGKSGMHRELLNFYKDRLRSIGYQEVKQSDDILTEPLIRNTSHQTPLYRLIFASKHPLGEEFWQKITRRDIHGQEQMF